MTRRALAPPAVDRREGIRGALLHTLPGRAIVVGLAVKLVVFFVGLASGGVPPFFAVVDTVAGLVSAVGLAYFAPTDRAGGAGCSARPPQADPVASSSASKPALLLVAFSLLCGFLLFYSFSGYLVQSRLSALASVPALSHDTALEIQRAGGAMSRRSSRTGRRAGAIRHLDRRGASRSYLR